MANRVDVLEDRTLLAATNPLDLGTLDGATGFRLDGIDAADISGVSVSSAGDVNGDGFDDLIIGAYRGDPGGDSDSGESYVVFGKSSGFTAAVDLNTLNGTDGFRLDGIDAGDFSGYSVSSAGDMNGDGFDDLVIGAYHADPSGDSDAGESYVVFGKLSGFTAVVDLNTLNGTDGFRLDGIDAGDFSGGSVSSAGDVNGDGFDDLIIGAKHADLGGDTAAGESYVVFGKSSGFPAVVDLNTLNGTDGFRLDGIDAGDNSGRSVSSAGDVNGDGFDDVIVGAFLADTGGNINAGESYVVFGKSTGFPTVIDLSSLDGTDGFRLDGIDAHDRSGGSVSSAGDVNGDGYDDLIIGALTADPGGNTNVGESYVVFGKSSGFTAVVDLNTLNGTDGFRLDGMGELSGGSVSSAGDVNGDGFDDLIIGARYGDPDEDSHAGESFVVFGKSSSFPAAIGLSTLDGTDGFRLDGIDANDHSGFSVSSAGDVNGDGFDDLIIGARLADPGGDLGAGESYVVFGGNFTGGVETQVGTSGENTLTANQGAGAIDVLVGGQGSDTLISDGGPDVLYGGEGNDTLAVPNADFSGTRRLVGGSGFDTLRLDGTGLNLDLMAIQDNRIVDVEVIDITGSADNSLTLDFQEVVNISSTSNTLTVRGNAGDSVFLGRGWFHAADQTIDSVAYQVFMQGAATVLVESPVTAVAINDAPTLDTFGSVSIDEDASEQTVNLTGITAGGGESQPLRVTASSSTGLILNPTVTYTSANATGSVKFTPVRDQNGTATITVTVEDGGLDGDLNTTGDNATFSRSFDVTVNAVNDDPTLNALSNVTINEDASEQTINLTGITAGGGESQPLRVTASRSFLGGTFAAAANFAAGERAFSVSVADFNGDGNQDLAVASSGSDNVSILLGDGSGSFGVATNFSAGDLPESVSVSDFNGDGNQDLVTANAFSDDVSILLGNGDGTFAAATNFGVGDLPQSVSVSDFNGDGNQDLVTANTSSDDVSILLGDGSGSFGAASVFAVGDTAPRPTSVSVGDFNGDGNQDLVTANDNSDNVSILLGDGSGSFGVATNFAAGVGPYSVSVGDFNGDGNQDLAVANEFSDAVSILLGDGIGSFSAATDFATGAVRARDISVGDFNGDGFLDLAVANQNTSNVSILLGDGTGSFGMATNFAVSSSSQQSVSVGDFNGDGIQDLAVAVGLPAVSDNVRILLGESGIIPNPMVTYTSADATGTLKFTPVADQSGSETITVTVEDGGLDGDLNTAADNATFSRVFDVTVSALDDFGDAPAPYPTSLAEDGARHNDVGPMLGATRDEEADGAHSSAADSDGADEDGVTFTSVIQVGALGTTVTVNVQGGTGKLDAWIDFNGDGSWGGPGEQIFASQNVVVGNNNLTFDVPSYAIAGTTYARFRLSTAGGLGVAGAAENGEVEDYQVTIQSPASASGVFGGQNTISTAADNARSVFAADVDGDGDLDVLSASRFDDKIAWYENDGSQNFTPHTISLLADFAKSVFAADVDGDGDVDVLSASAVDDKIAWYENDGSQNFTPHIISTASDSASSVFAADVDGDGDLDVLSASFNDDKIAWYENDGTQNFTPHTISTAADGAESVFAADVDGDGDLDVLSASRFDDKIAWYENDGTQNFTARTISTAADAALNVFAADVDGDGDLDVLSASANDDKIAWYENDGTQNFTARTISLAANGAHSVFAADVDGDDDLDVLSASAVDDKIAWYENDGTQNFTPHTISTTADGAVNVFAADVDGDGDLDVISASGNDDKIAWYENNSTPTLNALLNVSINEDASEQTVNLSGITAGGGESQPLRVFASNSVIAAYDLNAGGPVGGVDSSGHGNHGEGQGALPISDRLGRVGQALAFNGTSDELTFNQAFPFNAYADRSLSFWVNTPADKTGSPFWGRLGDSDANRFNIQVDGNALLGIDYREADGSHHPLFIADKQIPLPHNEWTHIVLSRSGNFYAVYVNGTLAGTAEDSNPNLPSEQGWQLAGRGGFHFKGGLDDIRFFNRALSAEEIDGLYAEHESFYLPKVQFDDESSTAQLIFAPPPEYAGSATITVTVEDGGLDGDLDTAGDNATFRRSFDVTVNAVNDDPTLDAIGNVSIDEDASESTVNLTSITAGGGESQPLRVTASSSTGLILNPTVTYTSANTTGSVRFTPVADQSGTATITVTVEDGGLDGDLDTADENATFSRSFDVTVNAVNDDPDVSAPVNSSVDEDTDLTVTGFTAFDIDIDNALGFVRSVSGSIKDKDGIGTGFTHRLPGTGSALLELDPNIDVDLATGQLLLTSTQANIQDGVQSTLEAPTLLLPGIGTSDFSAKVLFRGAQVPNGSDQFGIIVGSDVSNTVRMIIHEGEVFLVSRNSGSGDNNWFTPGNAFEPGDDLRITLSRTNQKWKMSWDNLTDPTKNGESPEFDIPSLDGETDLYVGLIAANAGTATSFTTVIEEFFVETPDSETLVATLSSGNGQLSLRQTEGLIFTTGDGLSDSSMSFTGTLSEINAAIEQVVYRGNQDFNGNDTVSFAINDGGQHGSGGAQTTTHSFDVTVNAVNDDATLNALSNLSIDEDASEQTVNLAGITAGGSESQPLRVTATSDNTGLIPNPTVTYTTANATGSMKFTPVADASGTATITVMVEDGGPDGDLNTAADNATFSRSFDVTVKRLDDFGDAPAPYPVTLEEEGARHADGGPILGSSWDEEADGAHSVDATADGSDEDGVLITDGHLLVGLAGNSLTVNVQNASNGAKLDAWIDFNGDRDWDDANEQILVSASVVNGDNTLMFDVPGSAVSGTTYARLRLSSSGGLAVTGSAADGEVEDYEVEIDTVPPSVVISPSGILTSDDQITFTFQFSEPVDSFTRSDVTLTNAIAGTFTAVDSDTFTLVVSPVKSGTVTTTVESGVTQDAARNNNISSSAAILSLGPAVLTLPSGAEYEVLIDGSELVVQIRGGAEQFRQVTASISVLRIFGSAGDDIITVLNSGGVVSTPIEFTGENGNDQFDAMRASGAVMLDGGVGNDTLWGGAGNDTIRAGSEDDLVSGGAGSNVLSGGLGTDTLLVSGNRTLGITASTASGVGQDSHSEFEQATLAGGPGNNRLDASEAAIPVTLLGADGDDTLLSGSSADRLDGGDGNDFAAITGTNIVLTDDSAPGADGDTLVSIEGLLLIASVPGSSIDASGYTLGPVTIVGSGGADTLKGGSGNDVILGRGGRDVANGGPGDDLIMGGSGSDNLSGDGGSDTIRGGRGRDTIDGGSESDVLDGGSGSDAIGGGDGNDRILGGSRRDVLDGGNGNDLILGGGGSDVLNGGADDDTAFGGAGRDTLTGGQGIDYLAGQQSPFDVIRLTGEATDDIFTLNRADNFIQLRKTTGATYEVNFKQTEAIEIYTLDGNDTITVTQDLLGSEGNASIIVDFGNGNNSLDASFNTDASKSFIVTAGTGNDTLKGSAGADDLKGGSGDDSIDGGAADDTLTGGSGDDSVHGNEGDDSIRGEDGQDLLYGDDGDDIITGGRGNDTIDGGANDDTVRGERGLDIIKGGDGNDSLFGGDHADTIDGGNDQYRVSNQGTGNGNGQRQPANGHSPRQATSSQVKAIHAIASRNRIDVGRLVQDRFNVQRPDDLSISDASTLIDELKSAQTGVSR